MRNRALRLALVVSAFLAVQGAAPAGRGRIAWVCTARAQADGDLAAARKLFAEGVADESAQRYGAALEKFQRVQAVRDTQAVRYRIATCFEAMGKLRAALEAYTAASIAAGTDAESAVVARTSLEKVASLGKRVAHIVVHTPVKAPDDTQVKIDGEPVQSNAIGTPIVVDPGAHEVTASASGVLPFHAPATLGEGGTATVEVAFEPLGPAAPPTPVAPLPSPEPSPPPAAVSPHAPEEHPSNGKRTAGLVVLTAGGVLVAGAVVLAIVRESEIASLNDACPGGRCPIARKSELEATRSRAIGEGTAAIAVGAAGIVAAGVGIALVVTSGGSARTAIAPWVDRDARGLSFSARF